MRDGFIKVAAVTPSIKVADTAYNADQILKDIENASNEGAKVIVFPELCLTGYTCHDLFLQNQLLAEAKNELVRIADATENTDALIFIGLPYIKENKLYNVAAVLNQGQVLAFIPKSYLPNYAEYYECRHFTPADSENDYIWLAGEEVPFGRNILLEASNMEGFLVGCEICEDLWTANPPSTAHALAGATVMVNLSASNELVSKDTYRKDLVTATSARLSCAYIYASAGDGESTQDVVFSGHNLIVENGTLLAESKRFENGIIYGDIDIDKIGYERRRLNTFVADHASEYLIIPFELKTSETKLTRTFPRFPFVPDDPTTKSKRCDDILTIQACGLKKRLSHIGCPAAVIGVSGGLDSTLALLVTARAMDLLGLPSDHIKAITMPCFGTTDRTYNNACLLAKTLGADLIEIPIRDAVAIHFHDIGVDDSKHDVTYENCQARERTQVLMDYANKVNGIVIGTGDLSELALGWATYNGDHMSMYGVNGSVPKTLVKHLVSFYANTCHDEDLTRVLKDVLDTPVSPELVPPVDGKISQKTEEVVGPYELHDFFLYYMLRCGFPPRKIYRIAKATFAGVYDDATVLKWLRIFYKRFFSQQFKRSCLPDGPKVGSVAVSPRGDLRMPSDACATVWMKQIDELV